MLQLKPQLENSSLSKNVPASCACWCILIRLYNPATKGYGVRKEIAQITNRVIVFPVTLFA